MTIASMTVPAFFRKIHARSIVVRIAVLKDGILYVGSSNIIGLDAPLIMVRRTINAVNSAAQAPKM